MEKFNYGLEQLYIYSEGVYVRGASHVCTKDFKLSFAKNPTPAFVEIENLPIAEFILDGLPKKYNGKQSITRLGRDVYRPSC